MIQKKKKLEYDTVLKADYSTALRVALTGSVHRVGEASYTRVKFRPRRVATIMKSEQ
jgi:hypothetical protein